MRTCISCHDPIPDDRRKDARYCNKAACRGREYRKRRTAAAVVAPQLHGHEHRDSAVLHCPCGKRYLLQGNNLEARELGDALVLPPATTEPTFVTQTVPHTEPESTDPDLVAKLAASAPETVAQTVLHADVRPSENAPTLTPARPDAEALTQTDSELPQSLLGEPTSPPAPTSVATALSTIELYFTDGNARPISFWNAVDRKPIVAGD